jgi:hypothetical protein
LRCCYTFCLCFSPHSSSLYILQNINFSTFVRISVWPCLVFESYWVWGSLWKKWDFFFFFSKSDLVAFGSKKWTLLVNYGSDCTDVCSGLSHIILHCSIVFDGQTYWVLWNFLWKIAVLQSVWILGNWIQDTIPVL